METTTGEATRATIPIALVAIGQHAIDYRLPAPHTITLPSLIDDRLTLMLDSHGGPAWLRTVAIDHEENRASKPGWIRTTADVRIPSTLGDVHVTLRFLRKAPFLMAVS